MWSGFAYTGDDDSSMDSVGLFESCCGLLKAGYIFFYIWNTVSESNVIYI